VTSYYSKMGKRVVKERSNFVLDMSVVFSESR
jgi:hypothetical protein